ncbi:ABC transporter substrate-binding protein [Desulfovibrio sp. ZJ369]|uniref:ABC transporter substrate-binding protein n=1 Tax=Desulfovibrio sp. ZJ369 TaxID=2709793 RepID=UPI0013EBC17A|nr:ABC transporter substrate-binding protein [Desulfovibrio sp. ZJ369]
MLKKWISLALTAVFVLSIAGMAMAADKLVKVPTAWMDEHETFLMWYAKEKGWDKEAGLDVEIKYFNSGADILNALPSGEWVYAGMGAVPAMLGNLRYDTIVIANGNDESMTNGVVVRKDSPIAKVKGWNKDYPDVLGSPETVKGKTFLVTTVSSAHYALSSWLNVLGLKDSDVVIKNMDQAQAVGAFENKIGDGVALWAPHLFLVMDKGGVLAADLKMCKKGNPIVLIADAKYANSHPEITAKFLGIYLRAVNMLQKESAESLVPEYRRFFLEWAGKDYDKKLALKDIQKHPVYNLDEQLVMFDDSKGQSQAQEWQGEIADFFTTVGRITPAEAKKVQDGKYATNKFLKMVKTPIPAYK